MHELSIALRIIDIAQEELARQGGSAVVAVHLKLGPLAGVANDALKSAFELARENSPLATATLEIEDVPIAMHCPQCRCEQQVASLQELCCSVCGAPAAEITSGRECEVFAMEIET